MVYYVSIIDLHKVAHVSVERHVHVDGVTTNKEDILKVIPVVVSYAVVDVDGTTEVYLN